MSSAAETKTTDQLYGDELLKQLQTGWAPLSNKTIVDMVLAGLKIRLMRSMVTMISVVLAIAFLSYTMLADVLVEELVDEHDRMVDASQVGGVLDAGTAITELRQADPLAAMPMDELVELGRAWELDETGDAEGELATMPGALRQAKLDSEQAVANLAKLEASPDADPLEVESLRERTESINEKYASLEQRRDRLAATVALGEWLREGGEGDQAVKSTLIKRLNAIRLSLLPQTGLSRLEGEEVSQFEQLLTLQEQYGDADESVVLLRQALGQERDKRSATEIKLMLRGAGVDMRAIRQGDTMGTWLIIMALLTCTVGIANAMLMSVTERFREIATMKCLGAQDSLVVKMFLLESGLLGVVGAFLGIFVGLPVALLAGVLMYKSYGITAFPWGQLPLVVFWSLVAGLILAVGGAVAPAIAASMLKPVDALRVEE